MIKFCEQYNVFIQNFQLLFYCYILNVRSYRLKLRISKIQPRKILRDNVPRNRSVMFIKHFSIQSYFTRAFQKYQIHILRIRPSWHFFISELIIKEFRVSTKLL